MILILTLERRAGDFDHDPHFDFETKSRGFRSLSEPRTIMRLGLIKNAGLNTRR